MVCLLEVSFVTWPLPLNPFLDQIAACLVRQAYEYTNRKHDEPPPFSVIEKNGSEKKNVQGYPGIFFPKCHKIGIPLTVSPFSLNPEKPIVVQRIQKIQHVIGSILQR
jgi:hypothetical protein